MSSIDVEKNSLPVLIDTPVPTDDVQGVSKIYSASSSSDVATKFDGADEEEKKGYNGETIKTMNTLEQRNFDEEAEREGKYLTGKKLVLVFVGMLLSILLIALDQTILAPAIPIIASQFQALDQLAWIASAYFLTQAALLLLYGQILSVFDGKIVYIMAISIFEVGSIICAAAPNVDILILGRAIAGCGAAGIFICVLSILASTTRLEDRPKLLGLFGAVFAISSIIGPLLGGYFTDSSLSWRWCFWINPIVGIFTLASIFLILGPIEPPKMEEKVAIYTEGKLKRWTGGRLTFARESVLFRLAVLDWAGTFLMLCIITCLLLALQWGGTTYPWSSGIIIGLFVAFAVLIPTFVVYEWKYTGPSGIMPLRLFKNRTQVGACGEAFCVMFILLLGTYYLPIYYQAAKYDSAQSSGINILPFMLGVVVAAGASGALVSWLGYYKPWLVGGPLISCIGGGLLYTIIPSTSTAQLVGYQILMSLGVGMALQNVLIAVQCDIVNVNDTAQSSALVTFAQLVGGVIGISISSTIFTTKLASGLAVYAPNANPAVLQSVLAIRTLPIADQPGVVLAYVTALNLVYLLAVPAGFLAACSGMLIRNKSVKGVNLVHGGGA